MYIVFNGVYDCIETIGYCETEIEAKQYCAIENSKEGNEHELFHYEKVNVLKPEKAVETINVYLIDCKLQTEEYTEKDIKIENSRIEIKDKSELKIKSYHRKYSKEVRFVIMYHGEDKKTFAKMINDYKKEITNN